MRMARPSSIINNKTMPDTARLASTAARAPFSLRLPTASIVMASSWLRRSTRGDVDIRPHHMVVESTILQAEHMIGAGLPERVAQDVGVPGHRLSFGYDAHVRRVEREAMIDVRAGDVEFRRLPDRKGTRCDRPRPLPTGDVNLSYRGAGCRRHIRHVRQFTESSV